jgi:predicted phosphodiesterase
MKNTPTVAVISDVHGNSPALEAVLSDISRRGIEKVYCLGDVVNGMDPAGSLRLLRNWGDLVCLKGNAELALLTPDWDDFPLRDEDMYRGIIKLLEWWKAGISEEDLEWIVSWPTILALDRACMVHDSPVDRLDPEDHYVEGVDEKYHELIHHGAGLHSKLSDEELTKLGETMRQHSFHRVFAGHTHMPFLSQTDGIAICNAGSVGFNLDGDPRAAWLSVEGALGGDCNPTVHRIPYEVECTLALVDDAGDYPDFQAEGVQEAYKQMIRTGIYWRQHLS